MNNTATGESRLENVSSFASSKHFTVQGITTLLACKKTPIMDRCLVLHWVSLMRKLFLANITDKSHATHELLAFTPHFSKACDEMKGVSF